MSKITEIISYGCSYVAGEELLDPDIDPRCDEIKKQQGLEHWWNHHRLQWHLTEAEIIDIERSRSWPNRVAQHMGVPLINRSESGSSLAYSVWRLEQDIAQGLVGDHSLVLVGSTSPHRSLCWHDGREQSWLHHHGPYPNTQWHRPTILEIYDDAQCLWLHLGYLLRLADISRQLESRLLILEQQRPRFTPRAALQRVRSTVDFDVRFAELLRSGCYYDQQTLMGAVNNSGEQHAGHHPCQQVHDRYGDWIWNMVISSKLCELINR